MSLQILIDIGLLLIYCALFTLLFAWTWKFWMLYVNTQYQNNLKYTLLEIKLPREINKNPMASEIFLRAVYDGGGLSPVFLKQHWIGAMPAVTSLEIVSLEGVIHFFIRAESKFKPRIEAAIYSQYPTVEIVEWAEDYVNKLPNFTKENPEGYGIWGVDWKLGKKGGIDEYGDKDKIVKLEYSGDMYPIKTYIDWGLDKDPKEMYKNDPLTYLLEQFGAIGKGEYFCHQILIRDAAKWEEIYTLNTKKGKEDKKGVEEDGKKLSELTKLETEKYKKKWSIKKKGSSIGDDEYGDKKKRKIEDGTDKDGKTKFKEIDAVYARDIIDSKSIPPNERDDDAKFNIAQIQRKLSKPQVITKMRTMYIADNGKNLGTRIAMTMAILRSFNEDAFNTFGLDTGSFMGQFDYSWQDRGKKRSAWLKEGFYDSYVNRSGFFSLTDGMGKDMNMYFDYMTFGWSSYKRWLVTDIWNIILHPFTPTKYLSGFTLNLEELATLYHFPGEVAATPTLPRVDSVKSSAPANIPMK